MEELPNCRHLGDDGSARSFPSELHPPAVDDLTTPTVDVLALTLPRWSRDPNVSCEPVALGKDRTLAISSPTCHQMSSVDLARS